MTRVITRGDDKVAQKANREAVKELIKRRRKQLIVHSYGYYRLNDNIISDHDFDRWSKELVELQKAHPKEAQEVELWEYFKDFDGSTGMHLPTHLSWVAGTWEMLKRYYERELGL